MNDTTRKPLRYDAAGRRQAVLDAARRIFKEEGVDVPIERIALEAGVGRATVHRNFYDRKGLLLALLEEELSIFEAEIAVTDLSKDPLRLFDALAELNLNNAALLPHWQAMNAHDGDIARVRAKFTSVIRNAITTVLRTGTIRPDLSIEDVELISGMLGAAMRGDTAEARVASTRRALDLIKKGILG